MSDENNLKNFLKNLYIESGKLVREIRESHDDDIESAAYKLGIDSLLLAAIENGQSAIDIEVMDKMYDVYDVSVSAFNVKLNERISDQDAVGIVDGMIASFDRLSRKVQEDSLTEKYGASVGLMLRDIRLALNMSVKEIASNAGVKELYVYKLEAGEFDLRYIDDKIYEAYGILKDDITIRLNFSTRALFLVADTYEKIDLAEVGLA